MAKSSCCEWQGEVIDDSLKTLFQADEAYSNRNREKAIAYLVSQSENRIPAIKRKAERECELTFKSPAVSLQRDLAVIARRMMKGDNSDDIHKDVMRVDKKYALPGYYAFSKCMVKK